MRAIAKRPAMLVALALLATPVMAACSVNDAPNSAGPGSSQPTSPAATTVPAAAATLTPTAGPTSSGPGGIQNLVISSAEKSDLTAAFVAYYGVSSSDLVTGGPLSGTVYYAYDPATNTYWALASFEPTYTAPQNFRNAYLSTQGLTGFRRDGSAPWRVEPVDIGPTYVCNELQFFPAAVLVAWSLPTTPATGVTC